MIEKVNYFPFNNSYVVAYTVLPIDVVDDCNV